jgi:hypothetical protein
MCKHNQKNEFLITIMVFNCYQNTKKTKQKLHDYWNKN